MPPTPHDLLIDVPPDRLDATVAFWSHALDATPRWPDDAAADPYVALVGARSVLAVWVQRIDDGPSRYHLDLAVADLDGEADRLTTAGARLRDAPGDHHVLADPAGNLFCLVPGADRPAEVRPPHPDRAYLDAVFVDVPSSVHRRVLDFWVSALGASPQGAGDPYTSLEGVVGPGGDLVFEVQVVDDRPRFHVDVSATDVEEEAARLVAGGARRVRQVEDWWTLADPADNLLCVVPR